MATSKQQPTNSVDDSKSFARPVMVAGPAADSLVLKIITVLGLLFATIGGGVLFVVDRQHDAIAEHALAPHIAAESKEDHNRDIERIEKKLDRQDRKIDRILEAVRQ